LIHVAEQRRVADHAGKRVLIVGAGNSGVEFAEQLVAADVAQLWMSVRTPPNLLPLKVGGVPLQAVALLSRFLPESLRDGMARRLSRRLIGDLALFGLPAPPEGPYRRLRTTGVTAAVDRGFAAHLRAGRVTTVPEISQLLDSRVILRDGHVLEPDLVLAATGYRPGLEPIVVDLGVLRTDGRPDTGAGVVSPAAPGLWFIGYRPSLEGNLRRHASEARRLARAIGRAVRAGNAAVGHGPRTGDHHTKRDAADRPASPGTAWENL
jgi:cation diffusion facilitator CzcD-associated flavoprotein CzcO